MRRKYMRRFKPSSILEFDSSGKLLKSFGEGMFLFPHGLTVDKDGNIWSPMAREPPEKASKSSSSARMEKC